MTAAELRTYIEGRIRVTSNGCWQWLGAPDRKGYGRLNSAGFSRQAHRAAYTVFVGPVASELHVDHDCHNRDAACAGGPTCLHRRCVNPAHLLLATPAENTMRGKTTAAKNKAKSHCPSGHAYTPENTYLYKGWRRCRACFKRHDQKRQPGRNAARRKVRS